MVCARLYINAVVAGILADTLTVLCHIEGLKISPCSRNIYTMADVIRRGEWLLKREHNIITMSLSSLLDYLLLRCHHKTCEVHSFCLSEFFHTCRQAASVTPPCELLAFILNELSFQLEGR